jgi:catechol 2,3-dioxygenase-like lactoylglutathione lyase family enzyme
MARVTGIGGVFLRARDPQALGAWYKRHLGVPYDDGFAKLNWTEDPDPNACTVWAPFDFDTTYFGSDKQQAMVNFRVDDLDALLSDLAASGVEIVPERSEDDALGRFAWVIDCEGNRVELWEPPLTKTGPSVHDHGHP